MNETHLLPLDRQVLHNTLIRHGQFLISRQLHGGWAGAWYLPDLQPDLDVIKLSHNTSPSVAQVLWRLGEQLDNIAMRESAEKFALTLETGRCAAGGWPLYIHADSNGKLTPQPAYWDKQAGPLRGVLKNGCTTNATLFLLLIAERTHNTQARALANHGLDYVLRAQDANPLGLWANTHPLCSEDNPFGNCAAGLADDAGTPSAMCLLAAMCLLSNDPEYPRRLKQAAQQVASLFIESSKARGWARYYDHTGQPCDARYIEKGSNIELRTSVELIDALLHSHKLAGEEQGIEVARDWSSWAIEAMHHGTAAGWYKLYDMQTGRPVAYDGSDDIAINTELSAKTALILLKLYRATSHTACLDAARRFGDFLLGQLPAKGWWPTGYCTQTGKPMSYDWRKQDWVEIHDVMICSTPLALLQQLWHTTNDQRYLQGTFIAANRLIELQLECGGWAFAYQYNRNTPAGGIWRKGNRNLSRDGDGLRPQMHECQAVYCSESGIGSQIIAWELANTLALLDGSPHTTDWQTCYGMPIEYLAPKG